ncbi:hypothetical protein CesoFtcFv8_019735 [Champsocephalus esox]|uniref:Mediator of RNA polymerase II transcription subunit 30 n=1 Tax=Champsocephalus esox TaxID=159716 RepID=A0AAN8GLD9_9TELE|nr:hypothetical protein CesoFtcFv8_019735 [Champsocephalus esox]
MTTPPLVSPFGGQPPLPQLQQQAQAARDVNTASLCRIGQETVQDIVLRTMEIFQLLRNMQLPNGVTYQPNTHQDRLGKLQEHLRMLSVLFRKLRLVYDKCNENCAGMESIPPEQLIPFVEDDNSKHEDRSAGQSRPPHRGEERNPGGQQEAETEEPAAEADHGPTAQPHLGDQLHVGSQELSHTHTQAYIYYT